MYPSCQQHLQTDKRKHCEIMFEIKEGDFEMLSLRNFLNFFKITSSALSSHCFVVILAKQVINLEKFETIKAT